MLWPSGSEDSKLKRQKKANVPVVARKRKNVLYFLKPVYFNRDFLGKLWASTLVFEVELPEEEEDRRWVAILSLERVVMFKL